MKKLRLLYFFVILNIPFTYKTSLGKDTSTDTLPPIPTYTYNYCIGFATGDVVDVPDDSTIRSNLNSILYHIDSSFNFTFTHSYITPAITEKANWKIDVVDPSKDAKAKITFKDMQGNDTTIVIEYFAPKLEINNNQELDFGKMMIDDIVSQDILIENKSEQRGIVFSEITRNQKINNLNIIGVQLPYNIEPLSKNSIALEFNATKEGLYIDTLRFIDTCGLIYKLAIRALVEEPSNIMHKTNQLSEPISINPLPANEKINIKLNLINNEPIMLHVYDIYGKLVNEIFNNEISNSDNLCIDINLSNYTSGIYFFVFRQGTLSQIKKIEIVK